MSSESGTPSSGSSSRSREASSEHASGFGAGGEVPLVLRIVEEAYRSDTGRQRSANEDSYVASPPLFAVADGMGGAQAGEVASQIAVEAFEPSARDDESPERYLRRIAERANERIHDLSEQDSSRSGMGT